MLQSTSQLPPESHNPAETYVVLLPVIEFDHAQRLLPLASAVARYQGGQVVVLRVVVVPEEQPLSDGVLQARRDRAELDTLVDHFHTDSVAVRPVVAVDHCLAAGIRTAAEEQRASLIVLGWHAEHSSSERLFGPPIDDLLRQPPCDVAVARLKGDLPWRRLLLPVHGGPHTPLARDTAAALADAFDTTVTVLYATDPRFADDKTVRASLQSLRAIPRFCQWVERVLPAEQAILAEVGDHQAIILGVTGRRTDPEAPGGPLADQILRQANTSVVLVCHRMAQAEEQAQHIWQQQHDSSALVDRWFAENTFSSAEFEDLQRLVALKQQQGLTISLGLPALNEEQTIGAIIGMAQRALVHDVPLLDEIVLIDSRSYDRTREIAQSYNIPIAIHQEILPQYGTFTGKGEALWKSLYVLKGDLVVWVDTDIRNFHPRFVYGVLGPLLREPRLAYCKGFYRRPIQVGDTLADGGGGRVTELTARPLLNLFYPQLSGMVQPLSGEYAVRRSAIEMAPFFTGYGVEIGLLIDLLERHSLGALAQVDLQERVHRNQELLPLSKMAFAIIQVVMERLERRQRVQLLEPINENMKLIRQVAGDSFQLEVREIRDHERPPMASLPEYRCLRGLEGARPHESAEL